MGVEECSFVYKRLQLSSAQPYCVLSPAARCTQQTPGPDVFSVTGTLTTGGVASIKPALMERTMQVTAASLWLENSSTSLPSTPSASPVSAEWELITAIIPPYIFSLCLVGLVLNGFVLGVFLAHKDRLTVAEIYLANLALADFLLLCGLPFWAVNVLNDFNWPYGDALCKLVNSVIVVNFYTSVYTLVMVSVDRYLALVKTMKARGLRRTRYAKVACLVLWMLGLCLSTPTLIHRRVMFLEEYALTTCILDYQHSSSWKLAHQILLNVLGFVVPVLVIVFSSWNIVRALAQRKEAMSFQDIDDRKATVLVYAVTLLFLLCWGPFQVFTFLDTLCDVQAIDEELWSHALDVGGQVSAYLAFLNSAANPLLYVFSGQDFRRKVGALYRRTRHRRRGSDMTAYQRSVISTYVNRTEQIKPVVIFNVRDEM